MSLNLLLASQMMRSSTYLLEMKFTICVIDLTFLSVKRSEYHCTLQQKETVPLYRNAQWVLFLKGATQQLIKIPWEGFLMLLYYKRPSITCPNIIHSIVGLQICKMPNVTNGACLQFRNHNLHIRTQQLIGASKAAAAAL